MPALSYLTRHKPLGGSVPDEAKRAAKAAPGKADRARSKPAFRYLARTGMLARSVIYAMLAYLACDIALTHHSPSTPSGSGVLADIAHQTGGRPLLVVLGLGLMGYAVWRAAQAISPMGDGHRGDGTSGQPNTTSAQPSTTGDRTSAASNQTSKDKLEKEGDEAGDVFKRVGWAATAVAYLSLCGRALALAATSSGSGGGGASSHPQPFVAKVLRWPAGPLWIGLVGLGLAIGGVALLIWGCTHDYGKSMASDRLRGTNYQAAHVSGIVGEAARGILVVVVAVYLFYAAATDNPSHAKGLGGALYSFDRLEAGPELILLAAIGLASFAVYSTFEAFYRDI